VDKVAVVVSLWIPGAAMELVLRKVGLEVLEWQCESVESAAVVLVVVRVKLQELVPIWIVSVM
jgi:hypothetical protein